MDSKKLLSVGLIAYAIVCLATFSYLDLNLSNNYQRTGAAAWLADSLKSDLLDARSFSEFKASMLEGHAHVKIFTGLSAWPPLQLAILSLAFFVYGTSYLTMLLVPLGITLLTLAATFWSVRQWLGERTALLSTLLIASSTYFFYTAAAPMLEIGVFLFTLLCLHHFAKWADTRKRGHFYLSSAFLALGLLYKIQMVFILPALAAIFLARADLKKFFFRKETYKMLTISLLIVLGILSPLLAREALLVPQGLSSFSERTVDRLGFITSDAVRASGHITAMDFEFHKYSSQETKNLIRNRYNIDWSKKAIVVLTSTFLNWILIPFIIAGIFVRKRAYSLKSYNTMELSILAFALFNIVFFSLHGLLPRYTIPTAALLAIFAARGLLKIPKPFTQTAIIIVMAVMILQTGTFLSKVSDNEHVQSMQHDYAGTVEYMLSKTEGSFTIVTSRQYEMAFPLIASKGHKRAYIELIPENEEDASFVLENGYNKPTVGKNLDYPTKRPEVKFVVLHETLEHGPLNDLENHYSIPEFLRVQGWTVEKTIHSKHENSKTWIYSKA